MKRIVKILLLVFVCLFIITLSSCREMNQVKHNIIYETDNFRTYRKITVINLRSDKILMEFEGYLTTTIDDEGDVNIIIKIGENEYKLHYVHLATEIVYLSEQLENTHTDPYHWEIRVYAILPEIV